MDENKDKLNYKELIEFLSDEKNTDLIHKLRLVPIERVPFAISKLPLSPLLKAQFSAYFIDSYNLKKKLPFFSENNSLIPAKYAELSSDEIIAGFKNFMNGDRFLDLTLGLGIDFWKISSNFQESIGIEKDLSIFQVTEFNFKKIPIDKRKIKFLNQDGIKWLSEHPGEKFDWIYIDPVRRDLNQFQSYKRIYHPDECEPNVAENLEMLLQHTNNILVKTSPMFDFREGLKYFTRTNHIFFHSKNGELKEILYHINKETSFEDTPFPLLVLNIFRKGKHHHFQFRHGYRQEVPILGKNKGTDLSNFKYLFDPDVSLKISGSLDQFISSHFTDISDKNMKTEVCFSNGKKIILTNQLFLNLPGVWYEIMDVIKWEKAKISKISNLCTMGPLLNRMDDSSFNEFRIPEIYHRNTKKKLKANRFIICLTDFQSNRFIIDTLQI